MYLIHLILININHILYNTFIHISFIVYITKHRLKNMFTYLNYLYRLKMWILNLSNCDCVSRSLHNKTSEYVLNNGHV